MTFRTILLIAFLLDTFSFAFAQDADSLKMVLRNGNCDSTGIDLAVKQARKLIRNRQLDEAVSLLDLILAEAKRLGYHNGIIQSQSVRAAYYADKNDFAKSDSLYHQVLAYSHSLDDKTALMNTLNSMGLNYFNHGDYENALKHHQEAARMAKELGETSSLARYLSNMARIYNLFGDYDHAIHYGKRAIELEQGPQADPQAVVIRMINLSNYYIESQNFSEAVELCTDGIAFNALKKGEQIWEAYFRNNRGLALLRSGNYGKSIADLEYARNVFSEIQDSTSIATINVNLAQSFAGMKNWMKADQFIRESKAFAPDHLLDPENLRYRLEVASMVDEGLGNYNSALSGFRKSVRIRDSIFAEVQKDRIMTLREEFDTEAREDSIRQHKKQIFIEKDLRKLDQKISAQKSLLLLVSLVLIIALAAISFIAYRNYRKKQQAHALLLEKTEIIEEKNKENELLLGEIHHRVKNNLQVISSLLSLQGKSISDENARTAIEAGKLRVRSMELVHTLLYEGTHFSFIEMRVFTQRLLNNLCDVYGIDIKKIKVNLLFPELRLDIDTAMPIALILNETIVNAFKHSYPLRKEGFEITVDLSLRNDELVLIVKDNGTNVRKEEVEGFGSFGFRLIELLTRQLRGTMELQYGEGLNYTFRFREFKIVR